MAIGFAMPNAVRIDRVSPLRPMRCRLALYRYYRDTEPMLSALLRDAPSGSLVAEYLSPYLAMLRELADALADAWPNMPQPRLLRAAIGHALAFTTWRSLALDQHMTDAEAASLMADLSPRPRNAG